MVRQFEHIIFAGLVIVLCVHIPAANTHDTAHAVRLEVVVGSSRPHYTRGARNFTAEVELMPPHQTSTPLTMKTKTSPVSISTLIPTTEEHMVTTPTNSIFLLTSGAPSFNYTQVAEPLSESGEQIHVTSIPNTKDIQMTIQHQEEKKYGASLSTNRPMRNISSSAGDDTIDNGTEVSQSTDTDRDKEPTSVSTTALSLQAKEQESSVTKMPSTVRVTLNDKVTAHASDIISAKIHNAPQLFGRFAARNSLSTKTNKGFEIITSQSQNYMCHCENCLKSASASQNVTDKAAMLTLKAISSSTMNVSCLPDKATGRNKTDISNKNAEVKYVAHSGGLASAFPLQLLGASISPSGSTVNAHLLHLHKSQALLRQAALVARIRQRYTAAMRVFYQKGSSESDLPECAPRQVCNRVDIYATPWVERQCRCPPGSGFNKQQLCPQTVDTEDGFSLSDRTRLFKTCEPVNVLPTCRYFRDITWTIKQTGVTSVSGATSSAGGSSSAMGRQTVNCVCPRNSVAYIARHEAIQDRDGTIQGFKYSFACSPQTRQTCGPSAPCRLFTVKRRRFVDEVNTNTLCECETGRRCPSQHTDESITPGSFFKEDHVKVFTGFCQPAKNISVSPVASVQDKPFSFHFSTPLMASKADINTTPASLGEVSSELNISAGILEPAPLHYVALNHSNNNDSASGSSNNSDTNNNTAIITTITNSNSDC